MIILFSIIKHLNHLSPAYPCFWGKSLLRKNLILFSREEWTLGSHFRFKFERMKVTLLRIGTMPLVFSFLRSRWWRSTWSCSWSSKAHAMRISQLLPAITRAGAATIVALRMLALTFRSASTPLPKSCLCPQTYSAPSRKNGIALDFLTSPAAHRIWKM